ncbi:hypothetical protein [Pseudoroseicyclus aestuarii]|uniref:Group 4 capsule polysaccharide lipoprotein GfcB/YjbF n=1 Tax=Pseudoroseicyclus aestuarii TaxID=1795041 RepID=A0A318T2F1_9RHOB|nr:hypothetical protein [Pseudoroseicyclus aestuarii]PYE84394.1 hypothetical protein DFP88_102192 [Pseudoroseicyclus aestuarii]
MIEGLPLSHRLAVASLRTALAALCLAPVATPAQEALPDSSLPEQLFQLPAGCEAYVTVQKRDCVVSHMFTCSGDPGGHQRRVDMDEEGMTYIGLIDAETQWIESRHLLAGSVETLQPGPRDPASFTELAATGRDGFDFITRQEGTGLRTRYVGEDRLTGETVTVDGVTLEQTEFQVRAIDPATKQEVWRSEGNEFINRDWRSFVSGTRSVTTPNDSYSSDSRPAAFAFPGEEGFLSSVPRYGCSAMMSQLDLGLSEAPA